MTETRRSGLHSVGRCSEEGKPLSDSRSRLGPNVMACDAPTREPAPRRLWPIFVPLAVVAIAVSLLLPAGRHQWALSLIRQPTPYTALSFNRAWALPSSAVTNQLMPISFTVANEEGRAINYRYVVTESDYGVSKTLGGSSKIVDSGTTWTVSTVVRPSCAYSPCQIQVSLPGHPEKIDFLVNLTAKTENSAAKRKKHG